jgi:hypothetical protein
MSDLAELARLIQQHNATEQALAALIGRPASLAHVGAYIAARVFDIVLAQPPAPDGCAGHFRGGLLAGRSVSVQWHLKHAGRIDLAPEALPDFYLVLTGPRATAALSRSWVIDYAYCFDAPELVRRLRARGQAQIGAAAPIRQADWMDAEVYPHPVFTRLVIPDEQRRLLALFHSAR